MEMTPGPISVAAGRDAGFGEPIKAWDVWSRSQHLFGLIGTAILAMFSALLIYIGFFRGSGSGLYMFLWVLGGIMAWWVIMRLARFVWAMIRSGRQVVLFERGLIEARLDRPKKLVAFSNADQYEAKKRIYKNGRYSGMEHTLSIDNQDGSTWNLAGPGEFISESGEPIAAQQAAIRLAEITQALDAGQQIPFETITLTPRGVLTAAGQTVPYVAITGWIIDQGEWTMTYDAKNPQDISGSVNDTINYRALRALLKTLAPQARI